MDKKFTAAAGATVTSAAFQLSTVVWPDWIKHHTGVVWALWAIAAVLWLWWMISHSLTSRHRVETAAAGPVASVNAPVTNQANPVYAPTFINNNNVPTSQSPPVPAPFRLDHPLDPNISIPSVYRGVVSHNEHIFKSDTIGLPTVTVLVENREANIGVGIACNLIAIVRFTRDDKPIASIQRAFWIGHLENCINLDIGQSCEVVIGQILHGVWFYYDNPRQQGLPSRAVSQGQLRRIMEGMQANPVEPRMLTSIKPYLDVAVSIVSLNTRDTLAARSFRILPNEEGTDFVFWLFPLEGR
ncbi:MAG TPA: hypothetical protein VGF82_24000 [Terracidiphilus sp.]|jgi:hypothetical protein